MNYVTEMNIQRHIEFIGRFSYSASLKTQRSIDEWILVAARLNVRMVFVWPIVNPSKPNSDQNIYVH